MNYPLEMPDRGTPITLAEAIAGQKSLVLFVRHLG